MKFRTEIETSPLPNLIEHSDSVLTIGSCFAENVGDYFRRFKFNSLVNPFGVLYNAASIKNSIELALSNKVFNQNDLFFDQSEWHSFFHHSDFSHHESENILEKISKTTITVNQFLSKVDWIIISLGTSFVYRHKQKNIIVSNCHKVPQVEFAKEFLSVAENEELIKNIIEQIRQHNPNAKFILTVSPVRHWKDGAHENQLSKSSLHLAIDKVTQQFEGVYYFPSYEILIDELRDYRFYAKDMIHPSEEAIEYIWEIFSKYCLSQQCTGLIKQIEKIVLAAGHKVRNVSSSTNKSFAQKNILKIEEMVNQFPYINFDEELRKFKSYLNERSKNKL